MWNRQGPLWLFSSPLCGLVPALDRTLFIRRAANLWWRKTAIQRRLTHVSGQADDAVQTIDTIPLPVCVYTRSRRDRCFKATADCGDCAAKDLHYYGFKLGLRVARSGMIIEYPLLPARPHDIQFMEDLAGFAGGIPADKGFIDAWRQAVLEERRGVVIMTPRRKGMQLIVVISGGCRIAIGIHWCRERKRGLVKPC